jgi:phage terminase large subunit-like protein
LAAQIVRGEPELLAAVDIIDSKKRIVYYETASFYRAIPADAPSAHGYNASAIIYDELHAAPNRELWDVLTTSMGARRQPLTFVITTAGYDRASICWELHDYALKVRDGIVDDATFLPVIYSAPDDADWLDEKVWRAVNPALGDFRSLDEMRVFAAQAREVPARQNTFRRLYLCQWTESASRWLDLERWDMGATAVDVAALEGRRCFGGLDLSTTTDLSALVLVFPDDLGGYDVVPFFWCPSDGIVKRARADRAPYAAWQRAGLLTATAGTSVDYDAIRASIRALTTRYRIERISYDRWNATQLVSQLREDGAPMVEMGQGFASMAAPAKELERLVSAGKLRHGGHPVLRWCLANTVIEQDAAGNIKPSKRRSTERIDGTVALVMALDGATRLIGSVYEERGLIVL